MIRVKDQKFEMKVKSDSFSLDNFSSKHQFIICVIAIFSLYICYGYVQEWIFNVAELKKAGMFVTLLQFIMYTFFGLLEKSCSGIVGRKAPMKVYYVLALLTVATMCLSNSSLGYLNYPTQVIFKSSKLIPVMIGGIIIQGKVYSKLDFLSCLLMTLGCIAFTTADITISPNFDWFGILLISAALCADAAIGNYQELCLKTYKSSTSEMVLYSYGLGSIILLVENLIFQKGLFSLVWLVFTDVQIMTNLFLFSLTGYIGVKFVLRLVQNFGALLAVTVTTCRKIVTIALSFVLFNKPFSQWYLLGGVLVVVGIFMNVHSKQQKKKNLNKSKILPM